MTTCSDIGKAIVELVRYKGKWPKSFRVVGERTTWNKVLETAERVIGEKFKVQYRSEAELQEMIDKSDDPFKKFYAQVEMIYVHSYLYIPDDGDGNNEILKNVKFTSVEELLRATYAN